MIELSTEPGLLIFGPGWMRARRPAVLLRDPVEILRCDRVPDVMPALEEAAARARSGMIVAGFVTYEAAPAFDSAHVTHASDGPLVWFGVYDPGSVVISRKLAPPSEPSGVALRNTRFRLTRDEYAKAFGCIQQAIYEGDVYQINYTSPLTFEFVGSPLSLWHHLFHRQPVEFGAYIDTGDRQILSCSPELFFELSGRSVLTRPMKGTIRRGHTEVEDDVLATRLATDAKAQAENVMIVDLLRNDLSRCCEQGSVRVPDLFRIERYRTLIQMTSEIEGRLRPGLGVPDLFRQLFPCGSVTGAPKISAMKQIAKLESSPRDVYCGAIGWMHNDEAAFNVAIRTSVVRDGHGVLGIGSGIVADSKVDDEFDECLLKARFLTDGIGEDDAMEETIDAGGRRID